VKDDSSAAVIDTAVSPVSAIDSRIANTPEEHQALADWVVRTFKPAYQRLGAPSADDSPDKKELRATLFAVLGDIGKDPGVIAEAKQLAAQYLQNPASVQPSLAQAAAHITAENGDAAFFDELQHTYETASNPQVQEYALRLLAEFRNPVLERRGLEYAVSGKVRNQDAIIQFLIGLEMPESRQVTWDFIRSNWDKVQAEITTMMGPYLIGGTGYFCSEEKKQEVTDFFATHQVPASEHALQRAKDSIDDCIELRSTQESKLQQWIAAQKGE
jgi:aminopeptidase N/puromycin-sensitive aminopeptidase